MDDVMTWFGGFLDENPDEFIIAVMRWESEKGGTEADFIRHMTGFLAGNSIYQARKAAFKSDLTLGECRGKIILISRTNLSPNSEYETAYTGWNHSNYVRDPHDINGTRGSGKIRIQDMYSKSENGNSSDEAYLAKKKQLVRDMMDFVGPRSVSSTDVYGDLLPQAIIDNNFRLLMKRRN